MPSTAHIDAVFYDFIDRSPVGVILLGATGSGLCAVCFGRNLRHSDATLLKRLFPSATLEHHAARLKRYRREIERYFQWRLTAFTFPLDLTHVRTPFQKKVLIACSKIPFGSTMSYGELAARAGSPRAARAVGNTMAANPMPIVIPCHRVLASQGALGGYSIGLSYKKKLLSHEGVALS